jgi:hypothetical protein
MFLKTTLCCTLLAACAGATAGPADPFANLGWLQGCWVPAAASAEAGTVETWTGAAGGTMFGMSRTVKGGRTHEFEFVQIREVEPGKLAYIAQPSGRPPTTFPLLRSTDAEYVFENAGHDFPQRVIYKREGANLTARIEGMMKGKLKGIDFPMKRASCDPAAQ